MKPRSLARFALHKIKDGTFVFDTEDRKREAIRQVKAILSNKTTGVNNPEDPIVEFHAGVYIPNFDWPIVPIDMSCNPIVWKEDNIYNIPGTGTHVFIGIGLSGERYYMSYLDSLAAYKDTVIKVDRYTDITRAAYAMICTMTTIVNKDQYEHIGTQPIKVVYDENMKKWKEHPESKEFEESQKKLYLKWLTQWIMTHGKNPETHMRVLKGPKVTNENDDVDV